MKIAKFLIRGFRSPKEAITSSFGSLERDTMNQIWRLPPDVSVREISDGLGGHLAYTTVMTTLDRLYKKGFLNRRKTGKAFLYSARMSREELEQSMTETAIEMLLDAGTAKIEPVLACIVDAVSERDLELLDELERLVQEKRQEILGKD